MREVGAQAHALTDLFSAREERIDERGCRVAFERGLERAAGDWFLNVHVPRNA